MKLSKSTSFMSVVLCAMTVLVMASTKLGGEACNPLCYDCASADELASPGIGLDLTLDYGTAAIKYENGTIIDVGKVDGSKEYRTMMQYYTAINGFYYHRAPAYAIDSITSMLQQLHDLIVTHLRSSSYPHEFIDPLPLPSSVNDTLPKEVESFPYSVRMAMRNFENIPYGDVETALRAAGLGNRGFYINGRSYNTVIRTQPSTFADRDWATIIDISSSSTSLVEEAQFVLAVEYTASALSLNVFSECGYSTERSVTRPDLGASVAQKLSADDLQTYYEDVGKFINYTIKQQPSRFPTFEWDDEIIDRPDLSTVEEGKPIVRSLIIFGDQPLSGQISLLKPLQNSLGFDDTVASAIERLDQMDTLYEGARGAASAAKKVSEKYSRYPSKPTCSDIEIVKYFREDMMSALGKCGGGSGAERYFRMQDDLMRLQM